MNKSSNRENITMEKTSKKGSSGASGSEVFPSVNFLNPDQKENTSLRDPDKSIYKLITH